MIKREPQEDERPAPDDDPVPPGSVIADTEVVSWIAERVCGPGVLLLIHRGALAAAATEISSQGAYYRCRQDTIDVCGDRIEFRLDGRSGVLGVADIVDYAREFHTAEIGRWLNTTYSRFLRATSAWREKSSIDPDHAAAELRAATNAWWESKCTAHEAATCG